MAQPRSLRELKEQLDKDSSRSEYSDGPNKILQQHKRVILNESATKPYGGRGYLNNKRRSLSSGPGYTPASARTGRDKERKQQRLSSSPMRNHFSHASNKMVSSLSKSNSPERCTVISDDGEPPVSFPYPLNIGPITTNMTPNSSLFHSIQMFLEASSTSPMTKTSKNEGITTTSTFRSVPSSLTIPSTIPYVDTYPLTYPSVLQPSDSRNATSMEIYSKQADDLEDIELKLPVYWEEFVKDLDKRWPIDRKSPCLNGSQMLKMDIDAVMKDLDSMVQDYIAFQDSLNFSKHMNLTAIQQPKKELGIEDIELRGQSP